MNKEQVQNKPIFTDVIFNISQCKTGTTSLEYAMEKIFNRKVYPYLKLFYKNKSLIDEVFNGDYTNLLKEMTPYNFFSDLPFNIKNVYKFMDKKFPNSKFILIIRNENEWIDSYSRWLDKIKNRKENYLDHKYNSHHFNNYIKNYKIVNRNELLKFYREYNKNIIEYFKNTDKLLVINLDDEDKIEKLCSFMKLNYDNFKNFTFPRINVNPPK